MQNIHTQFENLFKDLELTQDQKDQLLTVFLFCVYKNMLEIYLNLLGNKSEFWVDLNNFFDKSFNSLSDDQKKAYIQVITETNSKTLFDIISTLQNEIPQEMKIKLLNNVEELRKHNQTNKVI